MILKLLYISLFIVSSMAKDLFVSEYSLDYNNVKNKKNYCLKLSSENIKKILKKYQCKNKTDDIKKYTKKILKFSCKSGNSNRDLYVIFTKYKSSCDLICKDVARKIKHQKKQYSPQTRTTHKFTSNLTYRKCQSLNVTRNTKNLCSSINRTYFKNELKKLVCVGYSRSVCFSEKDKRSTAQFFKSYPNVLNKALDVIANNKENYHSQKLIEKFDSYIEKYGLENLTQKNRIKYSSTRMGTLYNPKVYLSGGSFPIYRYKYPQKAEKICKSLGGKLPTISKMRNDLKQHKDIKIQRGGFGIVVQANNSLKMIDKNGKIFKMGSWGDLLCLRDKNLKSFDFKLLNKVTFKQSQNFCSKKGMTLLNEKEAKITMFNIIEKLYKKRIKIKLQKSSRLPVIYLPYANSKNDYGYIKYVFFHMLKPVASKIKIIPINQGSKKPKLQLQSAYRTNDYKTQIKIYRVLENIGLNHYPYEYTKTVSIVNGYKKDTITDNPNYYFVFGSCKKGGVTIK